MKPIEIRRASPADAAFIKKMIALHHRHCAPPVGWMWAYIVERGGIVVGVATIGRPVNRILAARGEIEITRVCVWGSSRQRYGVCSTVYRQAAADGATMTYTRIDESGASLRAAGWVVVGETRARDWTPRIGVTLSLFPREPIQKLRWGRGKGQSAACPAAYQVEPGSAPEIR